MLFCANADCDYAVTIQQGVQVYSFLAEARTAAMHRAKTGLQGPVCLGLTDQRYSSLFASPPFGNPSLAELRRMEPADCGFPVLARLICHDNAEAICSQVSL